jgi:hypothetical protein
MEVTLDWLCSEEHQKALFCGKESLLAMQCVFQMKDILYVSSAEFGSRDTPVRWLRHYLHFNCQDDRDRVFSVLNILRKKFQDWNWHFEDVGYASTLAEVYTSFAQALISSEQWSPLVPWRKYDDVEYLSVASALRASRLNSHTLQGLQSWAADWRCQLRYQPLAHGKSYYEMSKNLSSSLLHTHTAVGDLKFPLMSSVTLDRVRETLLEIESLDSLRESFPKICEMAKQSSKIKD